MALNLNTELSLTNTSANAGTITLPLSTSIPGRVVTFKDILGTYGTNNLTLQTTNPDTFEDGGTKKVLKESYGSIQLVASNNKWYILNGTQVNTVQVSSLITNAVSSFNFSTLNTYISTLQFVDTPISTNTLNISSAFASTQNVSTNFLYYNKYVIAGTRIGYSNLLNGPRFSPQSLPGLSLWFDSSDLKYVKTNGSNVTQWLDKSQYANNSQVLTTNFPQVSTLGTVSLSTIVFNATNTLFTIPLSSTFDNSAGPYVLAVVCKPFYGGNNLTQINGVLGRQNAVGTYLGLNTRGFTTSMAFYFTTPGGVNEFAWTQSAPQLFVAQRTSLTPVSVYNTGSLYINNQTGAYLSNNSPFFLGYNLSTLGNSYYNGEICEVLFYNNIILTNFQRQQVEGYLAWKWGLQANLPASHPFFNGPPT